MDYDKFLEQKFIMADNGRLNTVRDIYTFFNNEVDLEAYKRDGFLEALQEMMEPILMTHDDHSAEVITYWAKRGMVKEFHGEDKPMDWDEYEKKTGCSWRPTHEFGQQNFYKRWNSFVPVSAFDPKNKGRKYPVVIFLHGGTNPISMTDGFGFPQEAAKREWILITPSLEMDDILDEILEEAKQLYPIDESRIYVTGYSYGAYMTNTIAAKRPDVYAAAAPFGAGLTNGYVDKATGPEPQTAFDGVSRAAQYGTVMPIMNASGNVDHHRFPIYAGQNMRGELDVENLLGGVNFWLRVNHAKEITMEECLAVREDPNASVEEKEIGLPLAEDCRRTIVRDGLVNYIGDIRSEDGIPRVRLMCMMNVPHFSTPGLCRQIFDFFSHFSRDPVTKASIYTA